MVPEPDGWGQPPPSPFSITRNILNHQSHNNAEGFDNSNNSNSNPQIKRRVSSPGSDSVFSGSGGGGGGNGVKKQRRDSDAMFGFAEEIGEGSRPLAITCAPCRTRKIKCDSKKPVCDNCSKNPKECYYPLKQKPGLRPGTGMDMVKRLEMLEDRVQHHENRIAEQEARLTAYSQAQIMASQNQQNQQQQQLQSSSGLTPLLSLPTMPLSTPSIPTHLPDLDLGGPSTGSAGQMDFIPPTSNSFGGPSASPSGLSTTSFLDPLVLPSQDIVYDLIHLFWTHIHPWAPILSPTPIQLHPPWNIVVHAIVVVTIRLSSDPRLEGKQESFKRAAKQHVLSHAIESTSLSSVQALALLALDLIGSDQGPSSWGILALLTRSAVHLGLTTEDEPPNPSNNSFSSRAPAPSLSRTSIIPPAADWTEDESRRRLFWLIFSLDRYACVSTGWDFALPDFDISRRLPCSDEIWAQADWFTTPTFKPIPHLLLPHDASTLSPFAYLVEALDLLGRSHTLQSQVIDPGDSRAVDRRRDSSLTLTSAARRWYGDLPFRGKKQDALSLMIQGIHHATLLKTNAYYAYPALSNGDPIEPYTSTCLTSARSVVALCGVAKDIGFVKSSTPLFIWSCWVAARVLFIDAFLNHKLHPDDDFETIMGALKEQALYWSLANQYVKLLERAKRKWLQSTTDGSNPNLPDAIHVLLDLRRTAYSAVANNTDPTPFHSPAELNLSHLPAWAVQPLLGDLHSWFDLPAGVFQSDM